MHQRLQGASGLRSPSQRAERSDEHLQSGFDRPDRDGTRDKADVQDGRVHGRRSHQSSLPGDESNFREF